MLTTIEHHPKYDMMRGIAALVVLFGHLVQVYIDRLCPKDNLFPTIVSAFPAHAVLVFFLLSGYLITASIIANICRNQKLDIAAYLSARIARIYPPLVGAILLVLCCWAIIYGLNLPGKTPYGIPTDTYIVRDRFNFRLMDIVFALTMRNGMLEANGPLWSLYIEFIVYIIAMFIAISVTSKSMISRCASIVIAGVLLVYGTKVNSQFVFFALVWFAGALSAIAIGAGKREKLASILQIPVLISVFFLVILGISEPELAFTQSGSLLNDAVLGIYCLCYIYATFISTIFDKANSGFLVSSGAYSYSLYITHFPLLLLIYSFTMAWMGVSLGRTLAVSALAAAIAVVFAELFSRYFENQQQFKPWIRAAFQKTCTLKRHLLSRRGQRRKTS